MRIHNHARRHVGLVLALFGLISAATQSTGPIRPASAQADARSWSYTGSLNVARVDHTATLLPDGKVLVAGGDYGFGTAELYDPQTGTWSLTGSLNVARAAYTATLLQSGKVLVAGGLAYRGEQFDLTYTAELYNPATGEWSFTGKPKVLRIDHTATLLPNGKVLFAGGGILTESGTGIDFSPTNTADLYDPATGEWNSTGKLSEPRFVHNATLLQDGKVLVAGGCRDPDCFFVLGSAEVYDPNTETWSITGSLNMPRTGHTLTMLPNGNALLSGGSGPFSLDSAELYNPATGLWSYTGRLLNRRGSETATLLSSGRVLVVGGRLYASAGPGQGEVSNSAELYDPATGKWNTTASLNTTRSDHTSTLLTDGKVLVVGGHDGRIGSDHLRSAELYDPEMLDPAPTAPRIIMASISGKKLFLTGENFHYGAVILLNGEEQTSKNDAQSPQTILIGKKAGKKVMAGDRVQVRNPNGSISAEFTFTGS